METKATYEKLLLELGRAEHNFILAANKAKEKMIDGKAWLRKKYPSETWDGHSSKLSKNDKIYLKYADTVEERYKEEIMFAEIDRDSAKERIIKKFEGLI